MWRLSALDSVASERRPRPPTRPVHPAGRASTGTALRSMPTATAAALRSPTRSSHHARGPSSSSSTKSKLAAVLADLVRDEWRSLKPRRPRASTSCGRSTDQRPQSAVLGRNVGQRRRMMEARVGCASSRLKRVRRVREGEGSDLNCCDAIW